MVDLKPRSWKDALRPFIPPPILAVKKAMYYWVIDDQRTLPLDLFLLRPIAHMTFRQRRDFVRRMRETHRQVECAHTHEEMVEVARSILTTRAAQDAVVVEAGCFKGGSSAKLSIAAMAVNRKLVVFDSFEGLPEVSSEDRGFYKGAYCGHLDEVVRNVSVFGNRRPCEFVKGWFEHTMPLFRRPVSVAYVDVDLVDSVKTCMSYLYPLLVPGGSIFSQDGHIPIVRQLLGDQSFWRKIGEPQPRLTGLGNKKLVRIQKPVR